MTSRYDESKESKMFELRKDKEASVSYILSTGLKYIISVTLHSNGVGIMISVSQMKRLKFRDIKQHAQGYTMSRE